MKLPVALQFMSEAERQSLERRRDRIERKEHRRRFPVQRTFPDAGKLSEAQRFVEACGIRLHVGDAADAAQMLRLVNGEREDVSQERLADAEALCPLVDA